MFQHITDMYNFNYQEYPTKNKKKVIPSSPLDSDDEAMGEH